MDGSTSWILAKIKLLSKQFFGVSLRCLCPLKIYLTPLMGIGAWANVGSKSICDRQSHQGVCPVTVVCSAVALWARISAKTGDTNSRAQNSWSGELQIERWHSGVNLCRVMCCALPQIQKKKKNHLNCGSRKKTNPFSCQNQVHRIRV